MSKNLDTQRKDWAFHLIQLKITEHYNQMKNRFLGFLIFLSFCSCQSHKYKISDYFAENEQDTLLVNVITYIYTLAPSATRETKFQPQFRSFYTKNITKFNFQNYYQAPDGWHYFFLIRPVGASTEYKRGVLGKFKLEANSLMPQDFEEVANTPHLKEEVVKERGQYLFQELIKNGNLDKQIPMKHYVEWPDEHLAYDKALHEWKVIKPY
ncbi:MAG: hypothetical protein MUF58_13735 [Arcicella sp.]|jgi:hypothetical protein|nr:hypothetical protein [Arcicella sp.]